MAERKTTRDIIRRAPKGWQRSGFISVNSSSYPRTTFSAGDNHQLADMNVRIEIKPAFILESGETNRFGGVEDENHPCSEELKEMREKVQEAHDDMPEDAEFDDYEETMDSIRDDYLPFEFDEWVATLNFFTYRWLGEHQDDSIDTIDELPDNRFIVVEISRSSEKEEVVEDARSAMKRITDQEDLYQFYSEKKEQYPRLVTLQSITGISGVSESEIRDLKRKEMIIDDLDTLQSRRKKKETKERIQELENKIEALKEIETIESTGDSE